MKYLFWMMMMFVGFIPLAATEKEDSVCVVFVCDARQIYRFKETYIALRTEGNYHGDVVLVLTDDSDEEGLLGFFSHERDIITHFSRIKVPEKMLISADKKKSAEGQLQKFYIFDSYFKNWDFALYLDCGMKIHKDIATVLAFRKKGAYLAPSDENIKGYKRAFLLSQFREVGDDSYTRLRQDFDLSGFFPRSTMCLFDTKLIKEDAVATLKSLLYQYPCGRFDQSYIALYVTQVEPIWEPITREDKRGYYYDFCPRTDKDVYVMHKYHVLPYKCPLCSVNDARLVFD